MKTQRKYEEKGKNIHFSIKKKIKKQSICNCLIEKNRYKLIVIRMKLDFNESEHILRRK